jgi:hypothetical protein
MTVPMTRPVTAGLVTPMTRPETAGLVIKKKKEGNL